MARRPLDGIPRITQTYGVRNNVYKKGYHTGVDYGVGSGTAVKAPANGTIVQVGDGRAASDGRGYFMIIKSDDGVYHNLYHLMRWHVSSGRVSEGQHVADSDNTGMSTGPHLHWETRGSNNSGDFNPADWLFTPATTPTPAPSNPGGTIVLTEGMVRWLYAAILHREADAGGLKNYTGKSLDFFMNDVTQSQEYLNHNQIALVGYREALGQIGNLSGQVNNLTEQINQLNKRPTQDQLNALQDAANKATEQAEKDRAKADAAQRELDDLKQHQPEPVDEQEVVQGFFKRLWDNLFKKGQ